MTFDYKPIESADGNRGLLDVDELSEISCEMLINAVTDYAIYMIDLNGKVTSWNAGAERCKGYTAEEIIGQHYSVFFTASDRAAGKPQKALKIAASVGRFEEQGWRIKKDGTRFRASVVIDDIRNLNGRLIGYAKITRDISSQRRAKQKLDSSRTARVRSDKQAALRKSDKQLGLLQNEFAHLARVSDLSEMAAAIAHEINQPLTAITTYLGAALMVADTNQQAAPLAAIRSAMVNARKQALRAGEIVRGLREFVGKGGGPRTVVHPSVLVESAMSVALIDAGSSGISVELRLDKAAALVEVDAVQIEQVIVNLIRNAVDSVSGKDDEQRRLVITTHGETHTGFVEFCVSDNGPGIDKKVRDRLFQPFVTSKKKGMGIGLSVSRRIVEAHGGSIRFEDNEGPGSTFKFTLPRSGKEASDVPVMAVAKQ